MQVQLGLESIQVYQGVSNVFSVNERVVAKYTNGLDCSIR